MLLLLRILVQKSRCRTWNVYVKSPEGREGSLQIFRSATLRKCRSIRPCIMTRGNCRGGCGSPNTKFGSDLNGSWFQKNSFFSKKKLELDSCQRISLSVFGRFAGSSSSRSCSCARRPISHVFRWLISAANGAMVSLQWRHLVGPFSSAR